MMEYVCPMDLAKMVLTTRKMVGAEPAIDVLKYCGSIRYVASKVSVWTRFLDPYLVYPAARF